MGLGPSIVKLYLELWQQGVFKSVNSVAEIGSQELHITQAQFETLIEIAGITNYRREDFPNLHCWPGQPRCSAKHFYRLLGVKDYLCIDLNGEHGALPLDLNMPLENKEYYERFDMVTDHGANEHVFNIAEAYRTLHRLCQQGGLIIVSQEVYGGNGYYNFDLSFFEGLAAANGYTVLFASYIVMCPSLEQYHIPLARELLHTLDWVKVHSIGICYVFRKTNSSDFHYPYQGKALSEVQANYGYNLSFLPQPPSRTYVPVSSPSQRSVEMTPARTLLKVAFKRFWVSYFSRRLR